MSLVYPRLFVLPYYIALGRYILSLDHGWVPRGSVYVQQSIKSFNPNPLTTRGDQLGHAVICRVKEMSVQQMTYPCGRGLTRTQTQRRQKDVGRDDLEGTLGTVCLGRARIGTAGTGGSLSERCARWASTWGCHPPEDPNRIVIRRAAVEIGPTETLDGVRFSIRVLAHTFFFLLEVSDSRC